MWKDSLLQDLLWYRPGDSELRKGDLRPESISPSWSWASVRGQVRFLSRQDGQMEGVQITETSYIAKGLPHMGEYSEVSIKLNAPFTEAAVECPQSEPDPSMRHLVAKRDISYPHSKVTVCGYCADYNFLDLPNQDHDSQRYAFVFVRFTGDVCLGLALRQRSDTEYERIGTCWCSLRHRESYGDTSRRERIIRSYLSSLPFREVNII